MTDLSSSDQATRSCPNCGAQNAIKAPRCASCGSDLAEAAGGGDAERDQIELEEAMRAASAEGYDEDFRLADDEILCNRCGQPVATGGNEVRDAWLARDTATNRDDLAVLAVHCSSCGADGRVVVPAAASLFSGGGDPSEVSDRHGPPVGATAETPLGSDWRFFEPGGPGRLAERNSLLDDEGEDIRQYTGEPVETEEGWVVPQQQNVGPGNMAGGGEFPDPNAPSAMPSDDEDVPHSK